MSNVIITLAGSRMSWMPSQTVYLAHPLRNDVMANMAAISRICTIVSACEDLVPLSPIHALSFCSPYGDQTVPLRLCREWAQRCDMLWLCGDWTRSEGCRMERQIALQNKIPVYEAAIGENWIELTHITGGSSCSGV